MNLSAVFGAAGLKLVAATETTLTGNQPLDKWEQKKHVWKTRAANAAAAAQIEGVSKRAYETAAPLAFPKLTIRPMEVRTFLVDFE